MKIYSHIANGLVSISIGTLMSTVIILEVGSVAALQSETGSAAGLISLFNTNSAEYSQVGQSIQQFNSSSSEGC